MLIAGTGSIAYAEIGAATFRAGGYGYLLGDKGSGYAIGAAALRHLLAEMEIGSAKNAMLVELAAHLGVNDRSEYLARIYQSATPVADIAACAPLVLRHAERGEELSTGIVQQAAQGLCELIARVDDPESEVCATRCFFGRAATRAQRSHGTARAMHRRCAARLARSCSQSRTVYRRALRGAASDGGIVTQRLPPTEAENPRSAGLDLLTTPALVELLDRRSALGRGCCARANADDCASR